MSDQSSNEPTGSVDRLKELESNFKRKKLRGTQLYWMKYNPDSDYHWDLKDAREDVEWMIAEIRRLREENEMFRELVDEFKRIIWHDIDPENRVPPQE